MVLLLLLLLLLLTYFDLTDCAYALVVKDSVHSPSPLVRSAPVSGYLYRELIKEFTLKRSDLCNLADLRHVGLNMTADHISVSRPTITDLWNLGHITDPFWGSRRALRTAKHPCAGGLLHRYRVVWGSVVPVSSAPSHELEVIRSAS